jgi:hypothetical protein
MRPIVLPACLFPLLALSACSGKMDQKTLEKKVANDWRHCEIVRPEQVVIEADDGKTLRYSYKLRAVVDGKLPGYTCYKPDVSRLEALANKNLWQIKAGEEIDVTQEMARR